ncbi:TatD family hydrolase [Candidatus Woesearchaeota archaeon]|nr:TatD family hydrolase [Candidatus Woesearchaeota archaeon]
MFLVDVHAHLQHELFKTDLKEVVERAKAAGVRSIIVNGVNEPTNREVLKLCEMDPILKPALGAYPIDALGLDLEGDSGLTRPVHKIDLDKELEFIKSQRDRIIGIGEVGLDFKFVKEPHLQLVMRQNFQKVIDLAEKIKKPLIVHTRNAEKETVEMLESSNVKKVDLHSFGARKSVARKAADLGFYASVPPVCVRLEHYRMICDVFNINQLLTETDSPWLGPVAGERNEPKNVLESVKFIAGVKKFAVEEVANNVWLNYQRLFG